jgi:hypothetical protein
MRREYGGGLHKFEPGDLENLLVLDVTKLTSDKREKLAALFDELRTVARKQPNRMGEIRSSIDSELGTIVGIENLDLVPRLVEASTVR